MRNTFLGFIYQHLRTSKEQHKVNSEFFFSYTGCHTMVKEPFYPTIYPLLEG